MILSFDVSVGLGNLINLQATRPAAQAMNFVDLSRALARNSNNEMIIKKYFEASREASHTTFKAAYVQERKDLQSAAHYNLPNPT
jgi:hypothetical protein